VRMPGRQGRSGRDHGGREEAAPQQTGGARSIARPWRGKPLIERIVGRTSIAQIEAAYSLEYPTDYGDYHSAVELDVRKQVIKVGGTLYCNDNEVGDFERTLKYQDGRGLAYHDVLQIQESHREHGLAREHYTRAIRFYDTTPIRRVELVAYGDGPWIWPQFGFDLASRHHKQRLRRLALERGFSNVPEVPDLYAADIATAAERGIESLKALAGLEQGGLTMYLDLDDENHRRFLIARGILTA